MRLIWFMDWYKHVFTVKGKYLFVIDVVGFAMSGGICFICEIVFNC